MAITHGLDRAHIGSICDALTAAGIDPAVWSARAITNALNTDMRTRGWTWPDHITNPGAFLHSRLRRLSWTPPETSTKAGGCAAASTDQTPTPVVLTDASRARIAAAQQEIRRVLRDSAQRTHKDARQQHVRQAITSTPGWPPAKLETTSSGYVLPVRQPGKRPPTINGEPAVTDGVLTGDQPTHHRDCT